MAGEGPVGGHLRNVGNVSMKAKNPWDTDILSVGAEKDTKADKESNTGGQYETGGGTGKGPKGGENTNS